MPVIPYLFYEDVAAAQRFLTRAFGLRKFGATNRNKEGRIIHAAMKLGSDVVMMGHPGPKYRNPLRLGEATQCLLAEVPDVEQHYRRALRSRAKILEELRETPFGQLRYGMEDPEGHQWYFAEKRGKRRRGVRQGK